MVFFTYDYAGNNEYVVYRTTDTDKNSEVFCHLSESDLDLFIELVKKSSGFAEIIHVLDEDPMGDGSEPKCWP